MRTLSARAFKVLRAELFFMATFREKFRSCIYCFFLVRFHDQQFFFQAKVTRSYSIDNIPNHTFISFDIVEFYPSITEKLLDNVILFAESLTYIPDEHITIIKHAHKSLLFYREKTWIKKNHDSLFDVTMGSYDGAEICEFVGLFLLNNLAERFGKESVGLYRDDGLLILKGTGGRQADLARKDLHCMFNEFDLKVTAQINNHQGPVVQK